MRDCEQGGSAREPRSSARTADIDGYTPNRANGRWIEGSALPYAVARRELLPGEVLRDAEILRGFGTAGDATFTAPDFGEPGFVPGGISFGSVTVGSTGYVTDAGC